MLHMWKQLSYLRIHVCMCTWVRVDVCVCVRTDMNELYAFACVHMPTCIYMHMYVHEQGRVLNYYMLLLLVFFDISICVNVFPYLCVYMYGYVPHLWWCIIVWYLQQEPSWLCNEKRYWLPPWNPLFLYIHIYTYQNWICAPLTT